MKLGIALNNLSMNQLTFYVLHNVTKFMQENPYGDIIIFRENQDRPMMPSDIPMMQISEAWCFDSPIVTTSLSNANKIIAIPGPPQKFFYIWDLEWLRFKPFVFQSMANIYRHSELQLIARSKAHADIIHKCWNKKVCGIVDDFNMTQLLEITHNVKTN